MKVHDLEELLSTNNGDAEIVFFNKGYEWYGIEKLTNLHFVERPKVIYVLFAHAREHDIKEINKHYKLYTAGKIKLTEEPHFHDEDESNEEF